MSQLTLDFLRLMTQNTPIHCLGFWPDYDASFFASAKSPYVVHIINPYQLSQVTQRVSKYPRIIREPFIQYFIRKYIKSHAHDFFIFGENRVILKSLTQLAAPVNGSIILRNCITKPNGKSVKLLQKLQQIGYIVWSFDQKDCERFGFSWYQQFIAPLTQATHIEPQIDFSFIGQNKGRQSILNQLAQILTEGNYCYDFDIREPGQNNLSYEQYLKHILRAKCLVDIVQKGQIGLTLRPLEALVYNRKLLTNNPAVISQSFYFSENILFLDTNIEFEDIRKFMNKAYVPVDSHIVEGYGVNQFICTVLT